MSSNEGARSRDISLADVVFAEATPRQRTLAWELNGASWAGPMPLDVYVGREATLSQTPLSANGGTKYLVLYLKDDPDVIVSACEVTTKEVLIAETAGNAGCRTAAGYAIASVFTAPQYRGRGLASHLLKEVQDLVDRTTEFGALYSDIGRDYYAKLGWAAYESQQLVCHLEKGFNAPATAEKVTMLAESDVEALCDADVQRLKYVFQHLANENNGKTYITFLPSFTQCSWHFTRDAFVSKALRGEEVRNRGAKTSSGASWIYWDHDLRERKLKVQRLVINQGVSPEKQIEDTKALLEAALAEASAWDLPAVGVWSPGSETSAAATAIWLEVGSTLRLVFESRSADSIPSLRWKDNKHVGEIVWQNNEYFAWC